MFMKSAFDPSLGLFVATQDQLLTPNTGSVLAVDDHLKYFNFIGIVCNEVKHDSYSLLFNYFWAGKMLGVTVYNRILVEPQLTGVIILI